MLGSSYIQLFHLSNARKKWKFFVNFEFVFCFLLKVEFQLHIFQFYLYLFLCKPIAVFISLHIHENQQKTFVQNNKSKMQRPITEKH